MKVFLSRKGDAVLVMARAEGNGILGDFTHEVRPGENLWGHPYAELLALGEGEHDLGPAPGWLPEGGTA